MKITEETRIKDLIPEGYEITGITEWEKRSSNKNIKFATIEIQPKEKSFEDYVKEFYRKFDPNTSEALYLLKINPEDLNMQNKLGLLWYIIKDKGGDLNDFANIVKLMREGVEELSYADTRHEMYNVLSIDFIKSFEEE